VASKEGDDETMNQIERVLSKELERERSQNEHLRERILELENELNTMRLKYASSYDATVDDN
jgi:uncharacterized protein YlxW (UPF0749 family)